MPDAAHVDRAPAWPVPAMVLAAGRGERMRPLTDTTPKPLLAVRGLALLQWRVQALRRDGVRHIVINTAWLGEQVEGHFGAHSTAHSAAQTSTQTATHQPVQMPDGTCIAFSREGRDFGRALETAGGIARALPLLDAANGGADIFHVAAGDIFAPAFALTAADVRRFAASGRLAHLWLVPNPSHKPQGDFGLSSDALALNAPAAGTPGYTFSTFALYRRALFAPPWCDIPAGNPQGVAAPLAPLLRRAADAGLVGAELFTGEWVDVGTPERLAQLNGAATRAT